MNKDLTTREGVAAILKKAGLFIIICPMCNGTGTAIVGFPDEKECPCCNKMLKVFEFPTANQSEAILDQLGMQVVWCEDEWIISEVYLDYSFKISEIEELPEVPRKDRELANAAAVAWFCINEPEKLTFLKK